MAYYFLTPVRVWRHRSCLKRKLAELRNAEACRVQFAL